MSLLKITDQNVRKTVEINYEHVYLNVRFQFVTKSVCLGNTNAQIKQFKKSSLEANNRNPKLKRKVLRSCVRVEMFESSFVQYPEFFVQQS